MTGMSDDREVDHTASAAGPAVAGATAASPPPASAPATVRGAIWFLEHMQDVVTVLVGVILVVVAVVVLIAGIVDFASTSRGSSGTFAAATDLVDRVLFVLILVEIVHTVVLSLRSHRLVAQPFIVVGLIAVIRRILFVLTPGSHISVSTSELALLIAMVAVFVASLIAVSRFEKSGEEHTPEGSRF